MTRALKDKDHIDEKVILDASALIALISEEPGYKIIEQSLSKAIMSCVNIAEVAKFFIDKELLDRPAIERLINQLIDEVVTLDLSQAYMNAEIYPTTKQYGLSLGDRACITLGILTGYKIYTTDKVWGELSIPNLNIQLIR